MLHYVSGDLRALGLYDINGDKGKVLTTVGVSEFLRVWLYQGKALKERIEEALDERVSTWQRREMIRIRFKEICV